MFEPFQRGFRWDDSTTVDFGKRVFIVNFVSKQSLWNRNCLSRDQTLTAFKYAPRGATAKNYEANWWVRGFFWERGNIVQQVSISLKLFIPERDSDTLIIQWVFEESVQIFMNICELYGRSVSIILDKRLNLMLSFISHLETSKETSRILIEMYKRSSTPDRLEIPRCHIIPFRLFSFD